jgi:hypothetical protein
MFGAGSAALEIGLERDGAVIDALDRGDEKHLHVSLGGMSVQENGSGSSLSLGHLYTGNEDGFATLLVGKGGPGLSGYTRDLNRHFELNLAGHPSLLLEGPKTSTWLWAHTDRASLYLTHRLSDPPAIRTANIQVGAKSSSIEMFSIDRRLVLADGKLRTILPGPDSSAQD